MQYVCIGLIHATHHTSHASKHASTPIIITTVSARCRHVTSLVASRGWADGRRQTAHGLDDCPSSTMVRYFRIPGRLRPAEVLDRDPPAAWSLGSLAARPRILDARQRARF